MILIRKVADAWGWMGNMAPFSVTHEGTDYRTNEALFQCLRFESDEVRSLIRAQKSPMSAKMIAKKHRSLMCVEPMSEADTDNMRMCLRLKVSQHPELIDRLLETKDEWIVEDCSRRPHGSGLFWGAAMRENAWHGENWLGVLWMELRDQLTSERL